MTPRASRPTHASPNDQAAETCCAAIQALGDFAHVTVRPQRGRLHVYADDPDGPDGPVARLHPLGADYGLSFHHHSGRWEPMPFSGDLAHMATVIVQTLGAYLARWENPPLNSGSHD